jgi:uncharacterized protein
MTPEEQQMLADLANKVAQTPPPQRDPQAEEFIRTRIGSRPDALYLMTQTVLIQNLALEHAKQQIQELQQKAAAVTPAPGQPSSFLGGGGPVTPRGSGWGSQPGSYSTPPAPPPPPAAPPPSAPASGGGSSFLRSAATTAAGVAAGALAFEGIRALFGGIEHFAGFGESPHLGSSGFLGSGGIAPSETVINNYYESPEAETRDDRSDDDSDDSSDDSDSQDDSDDSSSDDSSDGSYDDSSDDNFV